MERVDLKSRILMKFLKVIFWSETRRDKGDQRTKATLKSANFPFSDSLAPGGGKAVIGQKSRVIWPYFI